MRPSGWAFLVLSWGFIIALVIFCLCKILAKKKVE